MKLGSFPTSTSMKSLDHKIFKTNMLLGSKPIKRLPQTNLLHKNKEKSSTDPLLQEKRSKFLFYTINSFVKVKVSFDLKKLLDKIFFRNPRCKIFRDFYREKYNDEEIVFTNLFSIESEHPIVEFSNSKKIFDFFIISNKNLLVFDSESVRIDNDSLIIYNTQFLPIRKPKLKNRKKQSFEYRFISLYK